LANVIIPILSVFEHRITPINQFFSAHFRTVLALLVVYQVVMYGWVTRAYMHVSMVLLPWLLNQPGYRLYDTINFGYAPGYLWLNAVFYQFIPDHSLRLRLGTILIAIAITLLVFIQARHWWDTRTGLLASTVFALWGPLMLDYLLYFEFFLGLLGLAAVMVWQRYTAAWWRPVVAGMLVGVMILVKQPAAVVISAFLVWRLAGADWKAALRSLLYFGGGIAVPLMLTAGVLESQGVLSHALFLMTTYNRPYTALGVQFPGLSDALLLALWLGLIPQFVYLTATKRQSDRAKDILLILVMIALLLPAYPRYGRFHVTGALPFVALMSAGVIYFLTHSEASRWRAWNRLYSSVVLLLIIVAGAVLPVYYRVKLGSVTSQYDTLIPVSDWVKRETSASPGTRMWILPDIDPTSNFYPISGYDPPFFYTNTYPWYFDWPDLKGQVIAGLEHDPPAYVLVVDQWRTQIPSELWGYVQQHYAVFAEARISDELGHVSLYQRDSERTS
jgi:4-amino-4-deoxy-L-arabinose transferase-like glycosyltransferase